MASRHKISVFLLTVLMIVILSGTLMYLIEGAEHGFTSIPKSIYWAIVTLTTVGYWDIAPQTFFGQTIASAIMILGYGILAVPTGIVSAEMIQMKTKEKLSTRYVRIACVMGMMLTQHIVNIAGINLIDHYFAQLASSIHYHLQPPVYQISLLCKQK